ncbi:PREDICTED: trihelix transcription factor ASIL2 isoform X3 [Prunus mume]|uniref:Trihelix transcription factor ASIL2 isoform X3 n=1 Tax=Prunus mume TaxID=102107 RepID=A0ABM0NSB4_PRUMU|nr:PREDICTED: trihelix transcription factor ASIL2 isoform X3 [Prunus mume]
MDFVAGSPSPVTAPRPPSKTASVPVCEDCWSEDATFTLIEAWGERHLSLNRGNLRQKHWEEVADAVNASHVTADNPRSRRTDVQCKNRVDTLKKKYKIEKARVSDSNGDYTSPWPFFSLLDSLIGSKFPKPSPPLPRRSPPSPPLQWTFPVARRSATVKRPAPAFFPAPGDEPVLSQKLDFSAFAAVAAAAAAESEESEGSPSRSSVGGSRMRDRDREVGCVELAMAIERFAEIYERVEQRKQRQMVELEKQRMQFAKDLEYHRMQLFMETTKHQLRKIKRAKRSSSSPGFMSQILMFHSANGDTRIDQLVLSTLVGGG